MAISKIILNGVTQVDLTQDSVAAGNLIAPNTAHGADGEAVVGTATAGGGNDFIVTITEVSGVWTPDKTFAEIQSAYNSGKKIATYNDVYETQGHYYPPSEGMMSLPARFTYSIDIPENNQNIFKYYIYDENGISDDGEYYSYSTSDADAAPSDVTSGKIFYNADGQQTGTSAAITPTGTITITSNGTHDVTNYASAVVNVSGGGEVNIGTVTMTNDDAAATSIQFTGLKGTPKAFFVRCTTALSRSTSSRNYYVVTIRYNGTDTVGNRYYRYNGQYNIVTSGYSYTYSGGTLTLTSSGDQTTSPGAFYSGGYELVYIY